MPPTARKSKARYREGRSRKRSSKRKKKNKKKEREEEEAGEGEGEEEEEVEEEEEEEEEERHRDAAHHFHGEQEQLHHDAFQVHHKMALPAQESSKYTAFHCEGLAGRLGSENGAFSAPKATKQIIRAGQNYYRWQPLDGGRLRMSQRDRATIRSTGTFLVRKAST